MIDFNDLRTRVDGLSQNGSPSPEFIVIFGKISKASREITPGSTTASSDKNKLGIILNDFIGKIPTQILELRRMTADANDLAFALGMSTVADCITRIQARNKALADLTKKLNEQNNLAQKDADLLKQIKNALDNATKTVTEVKALINKISDNEADLKTKLLAFVDTVNNVSTIFKPQNA